MRVSIWKLLTFLEFLDFYCKCVKSRKCWKNSNTTSFLSTSDMVKEVPDLLWNSCTRSLTMILCHSGLRSKRFCIAAEIEATKNDDILDICIGRSLKESLHKKLEYMKKCPENIFIENVNSILIFRFGNQISSSRCTQGYAYNLLSSDRQTDRQTPRSVDQPVPQTAYRPFRL